MKLLDISRVMQQAPIYPGSDPVRVETVCDMAKGDAFYASVITTGSHMGTHGDAYRHFLPESAVGIDQMPLAPYFGPCRVVEVPPKTLITRELLAGRLHGCERLVLHGGGESYLAADGARYLVELGLVAVVTDAWSIAPLDNEAQIHQIILGAGMAVVESVVLDEVAPGDYWLCAFPLKIGGCDGAPLRAVLIQAES